MLHVSTLQVEEAHRDTVWPEQRTVVAHRDVTRLNSPVDRTMSVCPSDYIFDDKDRSAAETVFRNVIFDHDDCASVDTEDYGFIIRCPQGFQAEGLPRSGGCWQVGSREHLKSWPHIADSVPPTTVVRYSPKDFFRRHLGSAPSTLIMSSAILTAMPLSSVSSRDGTLVVAWSFTLPVEAVWSGLTDPTTLPLWLGDPVECDIRSGGRLIIDHGGGYLSRSDVTEAEAPGRMLMTWEFPDEPQSRIDFELRKSREGTVATLVHSELGALINSYDFGWMTHLTFLEAAAEGDPMPISQFWNLYATFESVHAIETLKPAPRS